MSQELGLELLQPTYHEPRIPVMEHMGGLSREAIRHFTGIDPLRERHRINEAFHKIVEVFEIDLLWGGGLPDEQGDVFDWDDGEKVKRNRKGHQSVQWGIFSAEHQEDGRHFTHIPKPPSVDAALDFQPLSHFPKSVEDYRRDFTASYAAMLQSTGGSAYPIPQHYTTCFHWALAIFGFELLCEAGMEEERFHALMERFAEISVRVAQAWSQVDGLKAFILHDDLTMTSGPIFPPQWYRDHIFVHYPAIFEPFREKRIPVIFCSDGNCSEFADDIFAAGAEGLNIEYSVDLEPLVRNHPDKIFIGNINSATLASDSPSLIEREVRHCIEIGKRAPRFVCNVGGGLVHTIPVQNLEYYLTLRKHLCRQARL